MDLSLPVVAGVMSTIVFALSTLPMLIKAARTKELASYSLGNLVLANAGNAIHSVYVFSLPAGPVWVLHTFYALTTALMLVLHLRYVPRRPSGGYTQLPIRASRGLRGSADAALVRAS